MKSKRQLLSQFLNGDVTRQQVREQLAAEIPLIFEVPVADYRVQPEPDAVGFYEQDGKRFELTYSQYKELAKTRDIAICIHNPFDNELTPKI